MQKYVPFFRCSSTIVFGGLVALLSLFTKRWYAEKAKDLATAIDSAKNGFDNQLKSLQRGMGEQGLVLRVRL